MKNKDNLMIKIERKYYVGGKNILVSDWAKSTKDAAIRQAQEILTNELDRNECVIVQIIGIVKRRPTEIEFIKVQ